MLLIALTAFNQLLKMYIGSAYGKTILLSLHLPTFLVFIYITRCSVIKMIFMILSALVFTAPTIIFGNIITKVLPGSSWALLITNLISYAIMLLAAQFIFRKGFNYLLKYGSNRLFLLFSLVPFLYYIYIFAGMNIDFSALTSASGIVLRYTPTLLVFFFYFLVMHNYKELSERRELETTQATLHLELDSAESQIIMLNEAQTQMAIYRHDMRHHLLAIEGMLENNNIDQVREYIKNTRNTLENLVVTRYCQHELVNLLCSSFVNKAQNSGITMNITARLPQTLAFPETELCAVISNGLENALNATANLAEEQKWVEFYTELRQNNLLIEIKNPYQGEIIIQDGLPVSNQSGHGYGCRSILSITEKNQGICTFDPTDNIFTLRIIIPVPQQ